MLESPTDAAMPDRSHESYSPPSLPPERPARAEKPDYGIDAPSVVWALFIFGIALILLTRFVPSVTIGPVTFLFGAWTYLWGALMCLDALAMLYYSKSGKLRHRHRMLA